MNNTPYKNDGYGNNNSRKRQRIIDSDDGYESFEDNNRGNRPGGFVSLGSGPQNKEYDDWNKAKHEFSDMISNLTKINAQMMGVGAPQRHFSYIYGKPYEN